MKEETPIIRYITMCILGVITGIMFLYSFNASAQNTNQPTQKEQSEWVEVNTVELPEGIEVFSGITRNGNPKYWIEIEGIKVFLSHTNKEHYINGTSTIILVEWYNKSTDRYKYTTRQKNKTPQVKRINLERL